MKLTLNKLFITVALIILLAVTFITIKREKTIENHSFTNASIVIYYWNLHSPPEGLENARKIIEELNPDFIWYAHWIVGFPMPPNVSYAYVIAKNCGFSNEKAEKFAKWVEKESYTLEHVKEQIKVVGNRIYCPCILGYSNFRIDFNFDPITFKCYTKEEINSMLLNFGKWNITNPKTGKLYTLEETQEIFHENFDLPEHRGVFDLSSPLFIEYTIKKALVLKRVGVKAVWYDMFFQLPKNLAKKFGYDHPMVRDLYNGACEIIERTKKLGLIVGTWSIALNFPYERVPDVDFVTASPSVSEILNLRLNYSKWERIARNIKRRKPGVKLIIIFDFGNRDDSPLPVFSQKLTPEQQREFLISLNRLARYLREKYQIDVSVAFPVHGPGLGKNPKRLAWGKYRYYDAKAPEFNTYNVIKTLVQNEKFGK